MITAFNFAGYWNTGGTLVSQKSEAEIRQFFANVVCYLYNLIINISYLFFSFIYYVILQIIN